MLRLKDWLLWFNDANLILCFMGCICFTMITFKVLCSVCCLLVLFLIAEVMLGYSGCLLFVLYGVLFCLGGVF